MTQHGVKSIPTFKIKLILSKRIVSLLESHFFFFFTAFRKTQNNFIPIRNSNIIADNKDKTKEEVFRTRNHSKIGRNRYLEEKILKQILIRLNGDVQSIS